MRAASRSRRWRRPPGTALGIAAAAVAAIALAGCASGTPAVAPRVDYGGFHPTSAEQAATLAATEGYRQALVMDAESLGSSLAVIEAAKGDAGLAASRQAELAAAADLDALRGEVQPSSGTSTVLGATANGARRGLQAIAFDLFARADVADASRAAGALRPEVLTVTYLLSRAVRPPAAILGEAQSELAWAVEVPTEGLAEPFSHTDLLDVAASARAAARATALCSRLGRLVDPSMTTVVEARLATLRGELRSLGTPERRVDSTISPATWRRIAADLDAADASIGELEGHLGDFASGRLYA